MEVVEGVLEYVEPSFQLAVVVIAAVSRWHLAWSEAVIGTERHNSRSYDDAIQLFNKSAHNFSLMNLWKPAGYVLIACSSTLIQKGSFNDANKQLEYALKIHEDHNGLHDVDVAMAWHNLGFIEEVNADYKATLHGRNCILQNLFVHGCCNV